MLRKNRVRVKPVTFYCVKEVFSIGRTGRPVHQLMRRKRTRVKHTDKAVILGIISCSRIEFIRGHITADRNNHSRPRMLRGVAVGGVIAALVGNFAANVLQKLCFNVVKVIYQHGTAHHFICLSAVITQMSGNKAALVLDIITLTFGQFRIFFCRF